MPLGRPLTAIARLLASDAIFPAWRPGAQSGRGGKRGSSRDDVHDGIATLVVMVAMSAVAMAAKPPNPVPGPPTAYMCDVTGLVAPEEIGENRGKVGTWDDQFFPGSVPLCDPASENFFLCLAKYGQFQIQTPSVAEFAADIVGMYLAAGASATQGKCLPQTRTYWLCYGTGANSLMPLDEVSAVKALAAGRGSRMRPRRSRPTPRSGATT